MKLRRNFFGFGFQDALVILCLYNLLTVGLCGFANDPGVGWHLRGGEYLFTHGIPRFDPFLHHEAQRPWISTQWLSDGILWLLYSTASWPLVFASLTVVYATTFLWILYRGAVAVTGQHLLTTLFLIVPFKVGQIHFILRPVIFGFFFFSVVAMTLSVLNEKECSGAVAERPTAPRVVWVFPPLFLLWSNVHPHFVFGLILFALLIVGIAIDAAVARVPVPWSRLRSLLLVFLLCATATVVTPYGYGMYSEIAFHARSAAVAVTHEFLPIQWSSVEGRMVRFTFLVIAAGYLCLFVRRRQIRSFELLSVAAFGYGTLEGVRFAPFFAIVALVPLVRAAHAILEVVEAALGRSASEMSRLTRRLEEREARTSRGQAVLLSLCPLLIGWSVFYDRLPFAEFPLEPSRNQFPYEAVEYLRNNGAGKGAVVVAAPLWWGGFITFAGEGKLRPLLDDRASVNGDQAYREYQINMRVGSGWQAYLHRKQAEFLLLPEEDSLGRWLKMTGALPVLFEDSVATLFAVTSGEDKRAG